MQSASYIDKKFSMLSFNARLLFKEMEAREISLELISGTEIVKATYKNHSEFFDDMFVSTVTYPAGIMADDKYYAKNVLINKGFKTTRGKIFTNANVKDALLYAEKLNFPVVLKPTIGTHGDNVFLDIASGKELEKKIRHFLKMKYGNGYYLIEKQYTGNEFRLLITKDDFFAAVSRIPANITGNGIDTIKSLIDLENFRRMNPRSTCLCEIKIDEITLDFLKKNNLRLNQVLEKDKKIFLRKNSNVTTGGNCYEITNKVHPTVIQLAKDILSVFKGMPFLGIDLLCKDVSMPLKDYAICELNTAPGLSLHMMPEKGEPKNVAKAFIDVIFPETK